VRLDRAVADAAWRDLFGDATLHHWCPRGPTTARYCWKSEKRAGNGIRHVFSATRSCGKDWN
jgi:hypothetical protein